MNEDRVWLEGRLNVRWNNPTELWINGTNVIEEVKSKFGWRNNEPGLEVTFMVGSEDFELRARGASEVDEGSAEYSSWTPGEPPIFKVGNKDIFWDLEDYDGKEVCLVVERAK